MRRLVPRRETGPTDSRRVAQHPAVEFRMIEIRTFEGEPDELAEFTVRDVHRMEAWPASRADVARHLAAALDASVAVRVRVDAINDLTGEYRIVLHGTLDRASHPQEDRFSPEHGSLRAA